jgi:hypothetical protein
VSHRRNAKAPLLVTAHATLIDGAVVPRTSGKGLSLFGTPATSRHAREKPFSIGSQELTDVEARIRDLDKFGIDTQIINSTLLNATLSPDIEFQYALCRAYNHPCRHQYVGARHQQERDGHGQSTAASP